MEIWKGYVEHIVFRNTENGYTVFQMVTDEEELTCVGVFSGLSEGELIQAAGTRKEHPLYGEQLQVEQYEILAPEDEMAMERYLGSGAIKGIGAAMAARIVRRFKGDTFRIIEEEPERLAEVKGISERKAMEISEQMMEKKELRQAMMFLTQYGISMQLAVKIYQEYGPKTYQVVQENPYRMADDITGVGFKMADEIAAGLEYTRVLITGFEVDFFIYCSRLQEKGIRVFQKNCCFNGPQIFSGWRNPTSKYR